MVSAPVNPPVSTAQLGKRKGVGRLAGRIEAAPALSLVIFTAIYAIAEFCSNVRRPFWIDELVNYYLADLPSISQIWPLIRQGIELNPPLPFWITWMVHHALGRGEVLTRLPALVGFWLMCVCLYCFVRRRSDAVHGFVAMVLPLFTYTAQEGTWARGYGLMLGSSAAALLCWQLATDGVRRFLALAGLATSVATAVSCHYYALYVVGALALGELVRTLDRDRIDFTVWIALAAGVSPLVGYLPLLRTVSSASHTFWITPMVRFLYESYAGLFGPSAMVLLLWLGMTLRSKGEGNGSLDWKPSPLSRHELVACLALAAMPLAVFIGAQVSSLAFYSRYVQPVVIGFSIILSLFVYRIGGGSERFRNLTISFTLWLCLIPWALWQTAKGFLAAPLGSAIAARIKIPTQSPLPVVIDEDDDFLTVHHYTPTKDRSRLFYLLDPPSAVEYLGSDTTQRSLRLLQTISDVHVLDYHEFISTHHEFLIARTRPAGWMIQRLLVDGANLRLIKLDKERGAFVEDTLWFHVKMLGG